MDPYPEYIESEEELEEVLTRPRQELIEFIPTLRSPLVLLGVGGKMGPSLAILARRAALAAGHALDIVAVSRFSHEDIRRRLERHDIHTIACDLMEDQPPGRLPDAENVIYLVGLKFGTTQNPAMTWALNTLVPAHVARRYAGSRIVALSSGSLYPLVPVSLGGAIESSPLTPLGEYPNACVARERIFEYFSSKNGTPMALIRLFYAVELRYGVLVDIAQKVRTGEPVDLTMGYLNWIWQADANEMIIRSLSLVGIPAVPFNLTHPDFISVREIALRFAERMGQSLHLVGQEAASALLGNASPICSLLGSPGTPLDRVLQWISHWLQGGGKLLGKPTHFEVRDGKY